MEKKDSRSRILIVILILLFLGVASGGFIIGYHVAPKEVISQNPDTSEENESIVETEETSPPEIIETYRIEKSPMAHNGTYAFSWVADKVFGARALDYLTPQIPEIFETLGIQTISQYVVEDDVAKYATFKSMLRCYNIFDRNRDGAIAVLCYLKEEKETIFFSVQVINPSISGSSLTHVGQNDFGFADFDGDGKDEVYVRSFDIGADNVHTTLGIFPFDDGIWGAPLFWAVRGGGEPLHGAPGLPYDFGFLVEAKSEPFTIKNTITGYSRELPSETSDNYGNYSLERALISSVNIIDVDADGVFELIIKQQPFHWRGSCLSLLKYSTVTKSFETLHAEFKHNDDPRDEDYQFFLLRAGFDVDNAVFLERDTIYKLSHD